jgi:hypothetical protein
MRRFLKYCYRWQFYTPALALCIAVIPGGALLQAVLINVLLAAFFYHADTKVFKYNSQMNKRVIANHEFIPYSFITTAKNKLKFWK